MQSKFEKFARSDFALEIRERGKIVFRSKKDGVGGLLAFVKKRGRRHRDLVVFDKVVGRAAALLFVYLGAKEVYGLRGSESASRTLRQFKIKFSFSQTIKNVLNKDKTGPCPLEILSRAKTPAELYNSLKG